MTEAALSVVLATDRFETVRRVVGRLQTQSVAPLIELVLATPSSEDAPELPAFAGVRLVRVDSLSPLGRARAAGVRAATAPLVYIGESHAYPSPDCAEALIAAHEEPWAAVIPAIGNANPTGALSWAGLMLDYGRWLDGPRREVEFPPAYNLAFKRELLLQFSDRLSELLEPGSDLAAQFRARGHRFLHEPAARVEHLNVTIPRHWLRERFLVGRFVASRRSAHWSRARRAVYCAGSPLLPLLLVARLIGHVRVAVRSQRIPRLFYPALGLGAATWAFGEMVGYAAGADERMELDLVEYELHKSVYASESVE